MKMIAILNPPNREHHLAAPYFLKLCLLAACLFLAWQGVKLVGRICPAHNQAAASGAGEDAPYDLAHDANYRAMVLLYCAQNRAHDFPF